MKKTDQMKNLAGWIENLIKDFINSSPENTLKNRANEKAWEDPLVGFSNGGDPLAPSLSPSFKWMASARYSIASTWSERHAAYTSGLGTFGLCDGLITSKGKAMRCGSVVTDMKIPATERPYSNHRAYCLFFSEGT